MSSLTIQASGQTIVVSMTDDSGSVSTRASVGGSPVTFPNTITTDTTYTFSKHGLYTVSALIDGFECYGNTLYFRGSESQAIAPSLTPQQLAQHDSTDNATFATVAVAAKRIFVDDHGGDPTGAADSTAAFNAAVAALGASPGIIEFGVGAYKLVGPTTAITSPGQYVDGQGQMATVINDYQTTAGDCIRMKGLVVGGSGYAGGVRGLTINGSNAHAGATGLHIGDGFRYELDVLVQSYAGAASVGVHVDNALWWTEGLRGNVFATNCTQGVVFDVTGANTATCSFSYMDLDIYLNMNAAQDGVVFQNGAKLDNGRLHIRGNGSTSASVMTTGFLRITGQVPAGHPSATQYSSIANSNLDVQVEVNGADAHGPASIIFGTVSSNTANTITNCYGALNFEGTYTPANCSPLASNSYVVTFLGAVTESVLNVANNGPLVAIGPFTAITSGIYYTGASMNGGNGQTFTSFADLFSCTLSGNITINLNATAGPQKKTLVIKQSSGGSNTVAWPHNASPTTGSPKVVWAAGSAPTMTATANATDVYKLETIDGATWYGQAIQNVS